MNKLIMKGRAAFVLLFLLIAATSCDDDDGNVDLDRLTAESFVQQAGISNLFEIRTSEIAVAKASTQEVRDFAQQMIADHTMATTELQAIAGSKGITVPTTLPQDKQAIVDRLNGKEGVPLDKDYMDVQEDAHEDAVELFERAANELDDQELKAFAQAKLPTLQEHLQMARQLEEMTDTLQE